MLTPGQRLRMMREARNQSLRELERAVGLHYSYLGALEREHKDFGRLKAEHLITLARYFGVSVDYLLGLTPPDASRLVRLKMSQLRPADLRAFRELSHPGKRARQVLQWLVDGGYPEFAPERLAFHLRCSVTELEILLAGGAELNEVLLRGLSRETGLPERLFLHGDLGPAQDLLQEVLAHSEADAYFGVLAMACRNGVRPESLQHLVCSLLVARESG